MSYVRRVRPFHSPVPFIALLIFAIVAFPTLSWAGGTPDPGTLPLVEDGGDADLLPDNENQLIGILGADRGFGFGDYVTDAILGLQSSPNGIGSAARYRYLIEVPPGQSTLQVEIFDAETGAGDVAGVEEHDQDNGTGWDVVTEYALVDPDGVTVASITLGPQDCDPGTVGLQTACNNAWSDLGTFSIANPAPGHWTMEVFGANVPAATDYDDNNSFGLRAHDGDATAGGTEYNMYADTYVGLGHVYASSVPADPGYNRTHDFFPYVTEGCSCSLNDWDSDDNGDETISLAPQSPATGATSSYTFSALSGGTNWRQNDAAGFTTGTNADSFGLWDLRFTIGEFNFITFWMSDPTSPGGTGIAIPPTSPGNGAEPNQQPEAGAIRLYFPTDGSRYFGESGGADDVVSSPLKPSVGQTWAVVAGPDPILQGATSRVRVTVSITNPTALPVQFDAVTAGTHVVTAQVPTNAGQTVYVAGSAAVNNSGGAASTATAESGAGPWNLIFAPGVVDAGDTVTVTYDIDVTPTSLSPPSLLFAGTGANGTQARFYDETCANPAGGTPSCSVAARTQATYTFGPLCEIFVDITNAGTPALTVTKTAGVVTDAGGGLFDVSYTVTVANTGTTNLSMVQVVDDLTAAYTGTATFSVTAGPVATGTLTANGGYNGDGDTNLLVAATSTLIPTDSETITYTVRFDPNAEAGPFTNTANGSAVDPSSTPVMDSDTAVAAVGENPGLNVMKAVQGALVDNGGGSFTVTYQVSLQNTGNVDLLGVQVVDDLTATFTAPASLSSVTVPVATGTLTANAGYSGDGDTDLLTSASSTLPVGATETITFSATFDAGGSVGPFTNTANGSGTSPQGTNVQDSDTADVTISENPEIDVVKGVQGAVVDNMNGTFTATYLVSLENTGDVALSNVAASDDLSAAYPAPAMVVSVTTPVTTGTLTANGGYNGAGDVQLLTAASSTLAVGATGTITYSVTFNPGGQTGPFTNTADGSGESPVGANVQDSDTADVAISENPAIDVVKVVQGAVVDNMNGTFTATYLVSLENTGDVALSNVAASDDLAAAYPAPAMVVSVTTPVTTGTLTANGGYNGIGDVQLLTAASSTLAVGATGTVTYSVTFDPGGQTGPFTNTANGSGDSPVGAPVQDSDTADVSVTLGLPVIGLAKRTAGPAVDLNNGSYGVSFIFTVENLGAFDLTNVQVVDDMSLTFPAPASVVTASVLSASGTLTMNPMYDGVVDINLLDAAASTLPIGALEEIQIDVIFEPANVTEFENSALATADSPAGPTSDPSDNGVDPDPNGNGNPDEDGENDPTPISIGTVLGIPSLNALGLGLLGLLLAMAAMAQLRRRA